MALTVDAIRAEMERVDAVRKVVKALRDEVVERVRNDSDREAILAKINMVEGVVLTSLLLRCWIAHTANLLFRLHIGVVLNKKEDPFTPDVKIVCYGATQGLPQYSFYMCTSMGHVMFCSSVHHGESGLVMPHSWWLGPKGAARRALCGGSWTTALLTS